MLMVTQVASAVGITYAPCLFLAYAIMKLIENNLHKSDDISIRASFRAAHRTMLSTNGIALCAVFALLLVVDGFIYSVLMNLPECSFFYVISH